MFHGDKTDQQPGGQAIPKGQRETRGDQGPRPTCRVALFRINFVDFPFFVLHWPGPVRAPVALKDSHFIMKV